MNIAIARHGLTLFPQPFMDLIGMDAADPHQPARLRGGLRAHVRGGFRGHVPGRLREQGHRDRRADRRCGAARSAPSPEVIDEALALACLFASATTFHLGTLSAACGCSNAAGVGLAAGLVLLQGGDLPDISLAVNNIVGNVTGMICDGAKIGCALKTMTSVDAAFRAASLAMSGIGHPGDGRDRGRERDGIARQPGEDRQPRHERHGRADPADHAGQVAARGQLSRGGRRPCGSRAF